MAPFFVTRKSRHKKLSLGVDHYIILGVLLGSGQSSYYYIIITIIVIIIIIIIIIKTVVTLKIVHQIE